jgi:transcriptional regulator with XRE-family HTH domain
MYTKRNTQMSNKSIATLEKIADKKLTLGNLLWSIRTGEEMTQKDFAELLGISSQYLCDIECSRKIASPKAAADFAKKSERNPLKFIRLALQDEVDKLGLHIAVDVA